ncbi:glycosyltransferase [Mycobacterium sp. pR1184]|uniref:glycosyltransferase n=1 Tax=Mycobacterium sp. pR1184 TaxID=3238981 RepID=UPI00351AF8F7
MKFVLAGYGTRGDVEPFAALARELRGRGHDVCLAVPPWMLGFVESTGLDAVAFGTNPPPLGGVDDVVRRVTGILADWSTGFTALANEADLLVTGKGEQRVAANVAEYYGIPHAALHFFPGDPALPGGLMGELTQRAHDAQRRDLGLPHVAAPAREPLEIQAYEEFCFPGLAAEWARQGKRRPFVGALTMQLPTDADDEVLSWIAAGTPPIYFGFGGAITLPDPAQTAAMISAACAQLGARALIGGGLPGIAPAGHVKFVDAVNHAAIFPACRAVVHHGGAGTTAAAMRAGVPTLILWQASDDQPVWGAAVTRLGVGFGREFWSTTSDLLIAGLRSVLAPDCVARARELATATTEPAESVARAADLLEDAAGAGRGG